MLQQREIIAPEGSPDWVLQRETLWNKAQAAERRKTAHVARKGYAILPSELSDTQNVELARKFLSETFVEQGMVADWSFRVIESLDGKLNAYVHFKMPLREIDFETQEFSHVKNRNWNNQDNIAIWRKSFETHVSEALEGQNIQKSDVRLLNFMIRNHAHKIHTRPAELAIHALHHTPEQGR